MMINRRRFLVKLSGAGSSVLICGAGLSARYMQQAHARQSLKRELLAASSPILNTKENEELAILPQQAQQEIREYFHGICLNVHGFTQHVCSNRFAEMLNACVNDERKHDLLNTAFSQKVVPAIEVLNRIDAMAEEIGAVLDRNWIKVCGQLNGSWNGFLKSTTPAAPRLNLAVLTKATILKELEASRSRIHPLGQRPALSQTVFDIGKSAILLLPVAVSEPALAFPVFLIQALRSTWAYVLGRLSHRADDYQLAITEHLATLGNRVGAKCEEEIRKRIADLHTFQQGAVDAAATRSVNAKIPAIF